MINYCEIDADKKEIFVNPEFIENIILSYLNAIFSLIVFSE
jgi:hypothetical protein